MREGRDRHPQAAGLNRHTEQVLVAGCVSLIGERLLAGGAERLEGLGPELVEVVLAPYLGVAEARRLARA